MSPQNRDDLVVDVDRAAKILSVEPAQILAMAEEGMLTPIGEGDDMRFAAAEVRAAHDIGG